MIASLAFEPTLQRVRRARFVPRAGLSLEAACSVANGLRDALQSTFGERCDVAVGDPAVLEASAWRSLAANALAFILPGRATDVVFVLPQPDARALIAAAFREEPAAYDATWTALEAGAVERIITRAAPACDLLCGERCGPVRTIDPALLAPCVDFFDVRLSAPVQLTIGVGILRELAAMPVSAPIPGVSLAAIPLELRVILGYGTIPASRLLDLRAGDVVRLDTKVAGEGELNLAGHSIAFGTCGVVDGRAAFDVRSAKRGDAP